MRILVLSIEYPPVGGGASPVAHELNKRYVDQGHSVTVVTMHTGDLPLEENVEGIDVIRVKCFRSHTHISYLWEHIAFILAAKMRLKQLMAVQTYDVCHTHFIVPTGVLSKWLKKKYQLPYVITAHGSDVPGYNPDRFTLFHKLTPYVIRSIIRESSFTVSPSGYLRQLIAKHFHAFEDKLLRIPNGVDTDYFQPAIKKPIVLSTGRILPRKGFQYLIEAVRDHAFPFEVHICGDGPMLSELREKAMGSKTPIVFHGWIDNKGPIYQSLLAEASVYTLVSAKENASISLLEALSSGCAVITSNVSGCPESVGEAGICIAPGDAAALKMQLLRLVDEPAYADSLRQSARKRAIEEFGWPSISKRYLSLLSKSIRS